MRGCCGSMMRKEQKANIGPLTFLPLLRVRSEPEERRREGENERVLQVNDEKGSRKPT